jgi:lactoylglutathione lyase
MTSIVTGFGHVGIRVHDLERSMRFYSALGFAKTAGPIGSEPVAILHHPAGIEINLILNAPEAETPNVLMDVPDKKPGITHIALVVRDLDEALVAVKAAGIRVSGGPVELVPGLVAFFVRDPDGNVIELDHHR